MLNNSTVKKLSAHRPSTNLISLPAQYPQKKDCHPRRFCISSFDVLVGQQLS